MSHFYFTFVHFYLVLGAMFAHCNVIWYLQTKRCTICKNLTKNNPQESLVTDFSSSVGHHQI